MTVNGGQRAHFFYRPSPRQRDRTFLHDVTTQTPGPTGEARFLGRQFGVDAEAAFTVEPPFDSRFGAVEGVAPAAVAEHVEVLRAAP